MAFWIVSRRFFLLSFPFGFVSLCRLQAQFAWLQKILTYYANIKYVLKCKTLSVSWTKKIKTIRVLVISRIDLHTIYYNFILFVHILKCRLNAHQFSDVCNDRKLRFFSNPLTWIHLAVFLRQFSFYSLLRSLNNNT